MIPKRPVQAQNPVTFSRKRADRMKRKVPESGENAARDLDVWRKPITKLKPFSVYQDQADLSFERDQKSRSHGKDRVKGTDIPKPGAKRAAKTDTNRPTLQTKPVNLQRTPSPKLMLPLLLRTLGPSPSSTPSSPDEIVSYSISGSGFDLFNSSDIDEDHKDDLTKGF